MKGTIKFIIRVNPFGKRFDYSYNSLLSFHENEPDIYSGEKFGDEDDMDEVFELLAACIVGDYSCLLLANSKNYVLGSKNFSTVPEIFPTEEAEQGFFNMVFTAIKSKFNDDFYENYDGKSHKLLFELDYEVLGKECRLIEDRITDTIEEEKQ